MIKNDIENRISHLFPAFSNKIESVENANTLDSSENIWRGVAEKYVDDVKRILQPVEAVILEVAEGVEVSNPNATPTLSVEVVKSVGNALVDPANFEQSEVANDYVDVKTHLIARPFTLSVYDLMHGERVESKLGAAISAVARGVVSQMNGAISASGVTATEIDEFTPETAAELSGAFDNAETHSLTLKPAMYAKLVPTSNFGIDPAAEGAYGISHIYKSASMPTAFDGYAMTDSAVAGVLATKQIFSIYNGGKVDV